MLIYLFGPDAYRRTKKLSEITDAFKKKHPSSDVSRFSLLEKGSHDALSAFLGSQSLFDGAKFAILTDLEDASKETAELIKEHEETKHTTLLVVSDKKLGSPFTFLTKEPVLFQQFDSLEATDLETFIKKESSLRDMALAPEDAKTLALSFKGDSWGLINELEKISLGAKTTRHTNEPAFFPLIQSLRSYDLKNRLTAVTYLIEREEPAAAFNIATGVLGASFKKKMADYDILIKSGKLEYEEVLLDLVL